MRLWHQGDRLRSVRPLSRRSLPALQPRQALSPEEQEVIRVVQLDSIADALDTVDPRTRHMTAITGGQVVARGIKYQPHGPAHGALCICPRCLPRKFRSAS